MTQSPLISVLITTFNAENTILQTLNSIGAQTYLHLEIIVVDDGSNDKTVAKINSWRQENDDINLKLFEPGRIGRGRALNYGVKRANGSWIGICDADDLWHPKKLKYQCKAIQEYQGLSVLATYFEVFTQDEEVEFTDFDNNLKVKIFTTAELIYSNPICHSTALIKKNVCTYNPNLTTQLDLDLWLRILDNEEKLSILEISLGYRRLHNNQKFEVHNNFQYRLNALKMKLPYLLSAHKYHLLPFLMAKSLLGLLPKSIRNRISMLRKKITK